MPKRQNGLMAIKVANLTDAKKISYKAVQDKDSRKAPGVENPKLREE
jgi:hypothetical protein